MSSLYRMCFPCKSTRIAPISNPFPSLYIHWTTPLHVAAVHGHTQMIHTILGNHTPINIRNSYGNTALMQLVATSYVFPWGEEDVLHVAQCLCECHIDVDASNYQGYTAEMLAHESGYTRVESYLRNISQDRNAMHN
jgi:ankyrin repeat protein